MGSFLIKNISISILLLLISAALFSCSSITNDKIQNTLPQPPSTSVSENVEKFKPCILEYPGKPAGSPERENLGPEVNSKWAELVPVISADGKTLYFVRDGHPLNKEGARYSKSSQDIWISEFKNGIWQKAYNPGYPLNNIYPNGVYHVSPDGNSLLLMNKYNRDGTAENGVSKSVKFFEKDYDKYYWLYPEGLEIDNFYNYSIYVSANISQDGKFLIMALERGDSRGELDIYISRHLSGKKWSEPVNLGDVVNTPGTEDTPHLAADGKTLYFASNGHCTYGESDIFFTKRLDDTWKNWSKPENLGPEINTPLVERGYFLAAKGDYAYFSAVQKKSDGSSDMDIFRVKLPEKVKPEPVYLITGIVTDAATKKPMDAAIIYDDRESGKELGVATTNPATGEYKIVLPGGRKYGIRASAEGYLAISKSLSSEGIKEYEEINLDLALNPIIKKKPVVLENIYFDTGKFILRQESYYELNKLFDFLQENPKVKAEISGHTDNVGSDQDNLELSSNRAKAVVEYLYSKGINRSRLRYAGYGESRPIADNNSDEGRQKNRRVELEFID